jgi:aryl-alcohol dehydrogenase-like predicted oxidoreductase
MKYKNIKDLRVSAIGFGCWAIGGEWDNVNDEESILSIKEALVAGINFFDVAPIYGKGHAEVILGKALKGEKREDIIIATKCGLLWDENNLSKAPEINLTKASILREVQASLKRLGTDYIDLYQLHWPDPNTPIKETASALLELKKNGVIRHIGVSNFSLEMTEELQQYIEVATFQGLYNLLEQNPSEYHHIPLSYRTRDEALPFCKDHNIKYLPYSPLMQGLLTGKFKRSHNWDVSDIRSANPKLNGDAFIPYFKCVEDLKKIADESNIQLSHLALHWLVNQEEIGPVLVGAHTPEQVRDNANFTQQSCSNELINQAEDVVKKWGLS